MRSDHKFLAEPAIAEVHTIDVQSRSLFGPKSMKTGIDCIDLGPDSPADCSTAVVAGNWTRTAVGCGLSLDNQLGWELEGHPDKPMGIHYERQEQEQPQEQQQQEQQLEKHQELHRSESHFRKLVCPRSDDQSPRLCVQRWPFLPEKRTFS